MKTLGLIGAALLAAGVAWADEPTITLTRAQQRYPWNGMVDIDLTVYGVDAPNDYYVRLSVIPTNNAAPMVLREFLDTAKLYAPETGTFRVTWNSAWEDAEYRFLSKSAQLQAELVFCGGVKDNVPYGCRYTVVDLTNGTTGPYPVTNLVFGTQERANAYFNTDVYKTTKIAFRRIRAGSFMMGSPTNEPGRLPRTDYGNYYAETQHPVTLTENFLIGVFPLTSMQYQLITGEVCTGSGLRNADSPAAAKYKENVGGVDKYVCTINWATLRGTSATEIVVGQPDSDSIIGKLNAGVQNSGSSLKFDLPTEAQWEYACRAGTTGAVYVANINHMDTDQIKTIANGDAAVNVSVVSVGSYPANPWGLYDMLGTVGEICLDLYAANTNDLGSSVRVDPLSTTTTGTYAVGRGGSYYETGTAYTPEGAWRCAVRHLYTYNLEQKPQLGARLACTLP